MLSQLVVTNFALIERLELDFAPGLTVLTGETGAGKSILIHALRLVLGARASVDLIREGCDAAEVSAIFHLPPDADLIGDLKQLDLGGEEELILRRVASRDGRSKAYINGRPVTVGQLAELAKNLVDISGQHQHTSLLRAGQHLELVDHFGGLLPLRQRLAEAYAKARDLERSRRELREQSRHRLEQIDFLKFQLQEIDRAGLKQDEEKELKKERDLLANAEKIAEALGQAADLLDNTEYGALERLRETLANIQRLSRTLDESRGWAERLENTITELADLGYDLSNRLEETSADPSRLEEIESRLNFIRRLSAKHGDGTVEILAKAEKMRNDLEDLESLDIKAEGLEKAVAEALDKLEALADELSKKRQITGQQFAKEVEKRLGGLGMEKSRFDVTVEPRPASEGETLSTGGKDIGPRGADRVSFMIAPNVGESLKPLKTIASGGELSRVMLACKEVLLSLDPVHTCVFDEVDTGIGGVIAVRVGAAIGRVSRDRQVICITHLPQIAAWADEHFRVEKSDRDGRTFAGVEPLQSDDDRLNELARMMTGDAGGREAVEAARRLLKETGHAA